MARLVSDGENKQKIIDTLESLIAFQQRNTAALFTHIDQGRLVDLELFKRDLELTAFNQNDLNSF